MFAPRYFPTRYFPGRYFPPGGAAELPVQGLHAVARDLFEVNRGNTTGHDVARDLFEGNMALTGLDPATLLPSTGECFTVARDVFEANASGDLHAVAADLFDQVATVHGDASAFAGDLFALQGLSVEMWARPATYKFNDGGATPDRAINVQFSEDFDPQLDESTTVRRVIYRAVVQLAANDTTGVETPVALAHTIVIEGNEWTVGHYPTKQGHHELPVFRYQDLALTAGMTREELS